MGGKFIGQSPVGPCGIIHAYNFRNDVASPAQHHSIANADIQGFDFILVVQGGMAYGYAAYKNRLEDGHRGQDSSSAYLDFNIFHQGLHFFRRKFVGNRKTGRPRRKAQYGLGGKVVHLGDGAINFHGKIRAFLVCLAHESLDFIKAMAQFAVWRKLETKILVQGHQFMLGRAGGKFPPVAGPRAIGQKPEWSGLGYGDIELPQAAGCRIARIGKDFPAFGGLPFIQLFKILFKKHNLAANSQRGRKNAIAPQGQGHIAYGPHCLGNHFPDLAVTPREGVGKLAVQVDNFQGQTVEFGIAPKILGRGPAALFMPDFGNPLREIRKFLHGKNIVQAIHPGGMRHLGQAFQNAAPNAGSRGIWRFKGRPPGLHFHQLPKKRVIFLIADLGRVQRMIQIIMPFQFGRQFFCPCHIRWRRQIMFPVFRNIFMRVIFCFHVQV